jgi:deoxycytidylate deaminase
MNVAFPTYFRIAKREAVKSPLRYKVGACLVVGKSIFSGFNKDKTHTVFANPSEHVRKSLHAELDCLIKLGGKSIGTMYIYRETLLGTPGLARPCEHCMKFLKDAGIVEIYYSTPDFPFWKSETI